MRNRVSRSTNIVSDLILIADASRIETKAALKTGAAFVFRAKNHSFGFGKEFALSLVRTAWEL
jgi:hypothetical protein